MEKPVLLLRMLHHSGVQTAVVETVTKRLIGSNLKDGQVNYQKDHLKRFISKTLFVQSKAKLICKLTNSELHHQILWEHQFSQLLLAAILLCVSITHSMMGSSLWFYQVHVMLKLVIVLTCSKLTKKATMKK